MLDVKENAGYEIIKSEQVGKYYILLGQNKNRPTSYVTWQGHYDSNGEFTAYWGHYIDDETEATKDYYKRLETLVGAY